jgi:hypothetical protein
MLPSTLPSTLRAAAFAALAFFVLLAGCNKDGGEPASEDHSGSMAASEGALPPPENEADRVLASIIGHFETINAAMDRIDDEESAKKQVPGIEKVVSKLHVSLTDGQNLDPEERGRSTEKYRDRLDAQTQRFSRNIGRLMTIPGASAPVIAVLESMPNLEPASGTPHHIDLSKPPQAPGGSGDAGHEGHDHEAGHEGHDH